MRYRNRITALLMCILLICSLSIVSFAHDVPKKDAKGKITVQMKYGEDALVGGELTAYYVGRIEQSNGNYYFVKTDDMKNFDGSYDNITSPELADSVFAFVKANKVNVYAKAQNKNGKAEFNSLDLGLYLIVQTKASKDFKPLKPFLVSVPMNVNGQYVYEVDAEGKFALEYIQDPIDPSNQETPSDPTLPTDPNNPSDPNGTTNPNDPSNPYDPSNPSDPNNPDNPDNPNNSTDPNATTNPSGEKLPLTGQLNWPIPFLAAGGLLLFALGWFLCFGRKRDNNAA